MKFKCGHEKLSGVGDWCSDCVAAEKQTATKPKPKTAAELKSNREYMRRKNLIELGEFVIEQNGLFRRKNMSKGYRWDTFSLASNYKTKGLAINSERHMTGDGKIMRRFETEAATRANYKAEQKLAKQKEMK